MTVINRLYASSGPEVIIGTLQINVGEQSYFLCEGYEDITAMTEDGAEVKFLPAQYHSLFRQGTMMVHRI